MGYHRVDREAHSRRDRRLSYCTHFQVKLTGTASTLAKFAPLMLNDGSGAHTENVTLPLSNGATPTGCVIGAVDGMLSDSTLPFTSAVQDERNTTLIDNTGVSELLWTKMIVSEQFRRLELSFRKLILTVPCGLCTVDLAGFGTPAVFMAATVTVRVAGASVTLVVAVTVVDSVLTSRVVHPARTVNVAVTAKTTCTGLIRVSITAPDDQG